MLQRVLTLSALLVLASQNLFSQKYSNEFLTIGVGARSHGMGGAQVAHNQDITAGFWNPAGLAGIESPMQIGAMHAEWFAGIAQYDYLSFGKSLNRDKGSYLGLSVIRLGVDDIPYTINLVNTDGTVNYDNLSSFSAADYAIMGSYAQKMKIPGLTVGASAKIVHRVVGKIGKSWGFGTDIGAQYSRGNLRFGFMAKDITTTFNAWSFNLTDREKAVFDSTKNEIPTNSLEITRPRFIPGMSWVKRFGEKYTLLSALDLEISTDGQRNVLVSSKAFNLEPRIGFELDYKRLVQIRAGISNFQKVKSDFDLEKEKLTLQPNFGLGLKLGKVQLDYALTDVGNISQSLYSHIFSMRIDLKNRG